MYNMATTQQNILNTCGNLTILNNVMVSFLNSECQSIGRLNAVVHSSDFYHGFSFIACRGHCLANDTQRKV